MKRSLSTIAMTDKEFHAKLTSADIPHLVSTYLRPVAVAWLLQAGTRYLIFAIDASIGNILTGALQAFLRQNLPSVAPINPRAIEWPLCLGYDSSFCHYFGILAGSRTRADCQTCKSRA